MAGLGVGEVFTVCPACGYRCDSVIQVAGDAPVVPEDGCVSVCLRCAHLAMFAEGEPGGLRHPTAAELVDLIADRTVMEAVTAIRFVNGLGA